MQADNGILLVVSGGQRYAVMRRQVLALTRAGTTPSAVSLAVSFGRTTSLDERYTLTVAGGVAETLIQCEQADLREALPQLALPAWLAQLAHPAVVGLVLDDTDLIPLVDLAQLALETGYTAA